MKQKAIGFIRILKGPAIINGRPCVKEKKFLDTFSSVREAVEELITEDDFLPAFSKVEFDEL